MPSPSYENAIRELALQVYRTRNQDAKSLSALMFPTFKDAWDYLERNGFSKTLEYLRHIHNRD